MRIGFDAKRLFFNNRGLGNYSRSTVSLLMRYAPQHSYTLFSPRACPLYGDDLAARLPVITPTGFDALAPAIWRSHTMGRTLSRCRIDLYHGLCHEVPSDIKTTNVRSVVTMHDLIFVRYPHLYTAAERFAFNKKYKHSCLCADRIIAISEQTRNDLTEIWNIDPAKIDVVYQGCSPRFAEKADQQTLHEVRELYSLPQQYLLYVGAIEERKNLGLVLRAMAEYNIDIPLVACGASTPYEYQLRSYISAHGLRSRVRFLHGVPFKHVPALYQMSHALVYPSRFEGFGIPIIEALTSGIPCITTRGGVFMETGGNACRYVGPDQVDEMAQALDEVINDNDMRQRMIDRGFRHITRFSESSIARNLMAVYQRAVEG